MSKRLKLISATEAEMEERSFPNPYPDWDQGVLTSNSGSDINDPFDEEGKVRCFASVEFLITSTDALVETAANVSLAHACVTCVVVVKTCHSLLQSCRILLCNGVYGFYLW